MPNTTQTAAKTLNQSVLRRYHSGTMARRIVTFFFSVEKDAVALFPCSGCAHLRVPTITLNKSPPAQDFCQFLSNLTAFLLYLGNLRNSQQVNGLHHTLWGFFNVIFRWQGAYKYFSKAKLWSFPSKQSVFVNWLRFLNIENWRGIIGVSFRFCNIWKIVPNISHDCFIYGLVCLYLYTEEC